MPEGLSPVEVGKELAEHRELTAAEHEGSAKPSEPSHRLLTIFEAVLLAVVAVLAAWSGFAAAKWSTESSLTLARASAARSEANRASLQGLETKNFDASTFNAWFTAYAVGNTTAMQVAQRRFRPQFDVAFKAWLATNPFTNPTAPKGPTYMPEYVQPEAKQTDRLDSLAASEYARGQTAGTNGDNYVKTTVFLASVLFLVGISGHFALRGARIALVSVGGAILTFSIVLLILAPKPPA